MSSLAPVLEAFFCERLLAQRRASPHTVAAYRDTFRLLLGFVQRRTGKSPSDLELADLDAPLIAAFLDHLERDRGNSVRTRNARLVAVHSLFRYAALREPAHAALIQRVLAVPQKRFEKAVVPFLTREEVEALLAAPDQSTWLGRRDHALLLLLFQTGLRVSELVGLRVADVTLGRGACVRCHGKGRKDRATPLTAQTASVLMAWAREMGDDARSPVFPSRRRTPLSRDAVEAILDKYARVAAEHCPSLSGKAVSPHVLRHSTAMSLLAAGVDTSVIALWLGHESVQSTQIYLHADMAMKQRALERTAPPNTVRRRYRPPDPLLAFLEAL